MLELAKNFAKLLSTIEYNMIASVFPSASAKELKENFSSRSAKLRYVIKKDDFYNFETDIFEKFDYLIKIENFGDRL